MRISDWSSDVCSSDLRKVESNRGAIPTVGIAGDHRESCLGTTRAVVLKVDETGFDVGQGEAGSGQAGQQHHAGDLVGDREGDEAGRSEEHTSELQSLMRISYAVFCLKQNIKTEEKNQTNTTQTH